MQLRNAGSGNPDGGLFTANQLKGWEPGVDPLLLRLEQRHELPALDALRSQLEESLGLKFEGEKGDHFFRSTLVQTLFYGMFASWAGVTWFTVARLRRPTWRPARGQCSPRAARCFAD